MRVAGVEVVLRPTFAALAAAEGELGSLFALVERAAEARRADSGCAIRSITPGTRFRSASVMGRGAHSRW